MKTVYLIFLSIFLLESCNAAADPFFYKPDHVPVGALTVPILLPLIVNPGNGRCIIKSLDLSHRAEVNDAFIAGLSNSNESRTFQYINLDNTGITDISLVHILNGILGTQRDLPQISGRYGLPASVIHLDVRNTGVTLIGMQSCRPVQKRLTYIHPFRGTPTADSVDGIKFLEFN